MTQADFPDLPGGIAVTGLAGRFPGAAGVDELWRNLREGRETLSFFTEAEVLAAGVAPERLATPGYVRARGVLDGLELFDAEHFGFTALDAEITPPEHRLLLECAAQALEAAAYDPLRFTGRIGVFVGVGANYYLLRYLYPNAQLVETAGLFQVMLANDKDQAATRIAYKLGLRGPAVTVQTACSTSLVAVHLACQSLLSGECDVALAGGASVALPQHAGYLYQEGGIASPDGHCRTFDAGARGTTFGNGAGVVALRRLADALAGGDPIEAVIRGSALNNDGSHKVGYTAPGLDGQASVVAEALAVAGVSPETIGYVEAHGTGTPLGDPIEVAALTKAYRTGTDRRGFCALGSVKTNVGHLDTAAGVTGLIKAVLAVRHGEIPPTLHFTTPNPELDLAASPFFVNTELLPWRSPAGLPRRAGVSSFGIGGTNAHVILEEPPAPPVLPAAAPSRPWQMATLSARTPRALATATAELAAHFAGHPDLDLADVCHTLQVGRRMYGCRRVALGRDLAEMREALEGRDPSRLLTAEPGQQSALAVFLFPGQGAQHPGMAADLHRHEAGFRQRLDRCAELLEPHLGLDLRRVLYPAAGDAGQAEEALRDTALAQPALFAVEYALAGLWMDWGIRPAALLGHSLGEYVAACLAGVLSLEDALRLVAVRGRLVSGLPRGAMLSVDLGEEEAAALAGGKLALAAVNAPARCSLAGPEAAIAALEEKLRRQGVASRRLHTSHAFHSPVVDPILDLFAAEVRRAELSPPAIPYISNLTGNWIRSEEATDPAYWSAHLRHTVRFADGVRRLLEGPPAVLLEVGPGQTLCALVELCGEATGQTAVPSLRQPRQSHEEESDLPVLLRALGRLWLAGVEVDWQACWRGERRRRVRLPGHPLERRRHWVEMKLPASPPAAPSLAPVEPVAAPAAEPPADALSWLIERQLETLSQQLDLLREVSLDGAEHGS